MEDDFKTVVAVFQKKIVEAFIAAKGVVTAIFQIEIEDADSVFRQIDHLVDGISIGFCAFQP